MVNNIDLHGIVMQQAETISKLSAQLAAFVLDPNLEPKQVCTYDPNLKGSDLVREHFRRGGGTLDCLIEDRSDSMATVSEECRKVIGIAKDGRFMTDICHWKYAVACTPDGRVLTASELLG